jgi:hypothetical protein
VTGSPSFIYTTAFDLEQNCNSKGNIPRNKCAK